MDNAELMALLVASFEDQRLDAVEKLDLREAALGIDAERKRFIRNRAFEIVRASLGDSGEAYRGALKWLEQVVKTLDADRADPGIEPSAYFSPGYACRNAIVERLHQTRHSVDICVFTIADDRLSDMVLKTHQRGVKVRIITDNDKSNDMGSDVDHLRQQGVPVRMDQSPFHMHHKFAVFDQQILLNGSFNWTRSASEQNEENVLLTAESALVNAFSSRFEHLWQRFG